MPDDLQGYGLPLPENPVYSEGRRLPTAAVHITTDPRMMMSIIQTYAKKRQTEELVYLKETDGTTVTREIEPYSVRFKITRKGPRKYLYGFCITHNEIHCFLIRNIRRLS